MASIYSVSTNDGVLLVIDCGDDVGFDKAESEVQARVLKSKASVAAVVVHHGAKFWVF